MYQASNPAHVRVEFLHFLKCDLKDLLILGGAILLAGGVFFFNWQLALVVLLLGFAVPCISLHQAKEVFASGDVCPAMVLDPRTNLVAVYTDLAKDGKPYPAVKVLRQPLGRVTGGPFEADDRLAFVTMYTGRPNDSRWRDIGGYLVNTGTTKNKVIDRVVDSIPDQDWTRLENALDRLDVPYRPGLYELRKSRS